MPILNYTTRINPDRSVSEIQRILARHGATRVMVEYGGGGHPVGLTFLAPTKFGDRPFRLPAQIAGVERALARDASKGKVPKRLATRDQAARVAWRVLKDWVESQLAIVEAGLASLDEVMLAYLVGVGNLTVYQVMVAQQLQLPPK
jgi:hypothetical protein